MLSSLRIFSTCHNLFILNFSANKDDGRKMLNVIGIDLGTTNSAVAIWSDGRPNVLKNSQGSYIYT